MWWGELHLGLIGLVLGISAMGHYRQQFRASLGLLAWWININLLWEFQGPQIVWTGVSGAAFAAAYLSAYFQDRSAQIYRYLFWQFLVVEALCAFAWAFDLRMFMSLRGAAFILMCLTVAFTWRSSGKWISQS